jgi:hypothetical protein
MDFFNLPKWKVLTSEKIEFSDDKINKLLEDSKSIEDDEERVQLYKLIDEKIRTWIITYDSSKFKGEKMEMKDLLTMLENNRIRVVNYDDKMIRVVVPITSIPLSVTVLRWLQFLPNSSFQFFPIWRAVKSETRISSDENAFKLILDWNYLKNTSSSIDRFIQFLKPFSIEVLDEDREEVSIVVKLPIENTTPTKYILSMLENYRTIFKPRKLTSREIDDIVSVVPLLPSDFTEVVETVRECTQEFLRERLEELELTPLGIADLKEDILNKFYRATVNLPQTPIGILAAEALGGPITQMTLNTFHVSGTSKSATSGVAAMNELLSLTKKRKQTNCVIHFRDKNLSFDEVFDLRKSIVGINLASLVKEIEVEMYDNLYHYWWIDSFIHVKRESTFTPSRWTLRLHLNTSLLYTYRISIDKIIEAIETEKDHAGLVKCIASPISIGIIDIHPQIGVNNEIAKRGSSWKEALADLNKYNMLMDDTELLYLEVLFKPSLESIKLGGIDRITQLFPTTDPTWSIVREEVRLYDDNMVEEWGKDNSNKFSPLVLIERKNRLKRIWRLILNQFKMINSGIPRSKLVTLVETAGMLYYPIDSTDEYLVVEMPEVSELEGYKNGEKPGNFVQKLISVDEKEMEAIENELKASHFMAQRIKISPLRRAAFYAYAETNGSNLPKLLSHPLIDPRFTTSNDFYEIFHTLGIEALRTFLIREFIRVISEGSSYINPRHITLLVEFMTNQGIPLSITYGGISRQPTGAYTKMTFERAAQIAANSALYGNTEKINTVSNSIIVGKQITLGTGSVGIKLDEKTLQQIKDFENLIKQDAVKLNLDEVKTIINDESLIFAADDYEGDIESVFQGVSGRDIAKVLPKSVPKVIPGLLSSSKPSTKQEEIILIPGEPIQPPGVVGPLLKAAIGDVEFIPVAPKKEEVFVSVKAPAQGFHVAPAYVEVKPRLSGILPPPMPSGLGIPPSITDLISRNLVGLSLPDVEPIVSTLSSVDDFVAPRLILLSRKVEEKEHAPIILPTPEEYPSHLSYIASILNHKPL